MPQPHRGRGEPEHPRDGLAPGECSQQPGSGSACHQPPRTQINNSLHSIHSATSWAPKRWTEGPLSQNGALGMLWLKALDPKKLNTAGCRCWRRLWVLSVGVWGFREEPCGNPGTASSILIPQIQPLQWGPGLTGPYRDSGKISEEGLASPLAPWVMLSQPFSEPQPADLYNGDNCAQVPRLCERGLVTGCPQKPPGETPKRSHQGS